MKKADCTPEEWAAHLDWCRQYYWKNAEKMRERQRGYSQRPETKAKRRKYQDTPEAAARRKAVSQTPEGKARRKAAYARARSNPEAWAKRLDTQRRTRTGLGHAEVERLLVLQGNRCGVCQRDFEGRQVRADHCHDSGQPRGLLCHHCNIIEGMMRGMELTPEEFATRLRKFLDHPPALLLSR